jgi:cytochrome c oxidase subunit 3
LSESESILRGHFRDMPQQRDASSLGMWVFLGTEIMFFGGLFLTYTVNRAAYPAIFAEASHHLDVKLGAINTAVLICSSLTMAMAVYFSQKGRRTPLIISLLMTMGLGLVFLGIKGVEYAQKFEHHLVPGYNFQYAPASAGPAQLYFSLYFGMTGMHALHMIIGLGILTFLLIEAIRGRYTPEYNTPIELSGLYWHFVDIIWIYLFPLLYLIDLHK